MTKYTPELIRGPRKDDLRLDVQRRKKKPVRYVINQFEDPRLRQQLESGGSMKGIKR